MACISCPKTNERDSVMTDTLAGSVSCRPRRLQVQFRPSTIGAAAAPGSGSQPGRDSQNHEPPASRVRRGPY